MPRPLAARFPAKSDQNHPQHKEGREKTGDHRNSRQSRVMSRRCKNLVLTPEARYRRNSAQGNRTKNCDHRGERHALPKTSHFPNVLLFMAAMYRRSCGQKEQALEKCVSRQMVHRCSRNSQTDRHDHVGDLGKGRIRENTFDVILLTGNQGGQ